METTTSEKKLPANAGMEKAVVATLLVRRESIADVTGWLQPEMFSDPGTAFIYSAILAQYNRGERPDYVTTEAEMARMDNELTQRINGVAYLDYAIHRIRSTDNLDNYAREVKRLYSLRVLHLTFTEALQKCYLTESIPLEVITETENALLGIRELSQESVPLRPLNHLAGEVLTLHRKQNSDEIRQLSVPSGLDQLDALFGGFHPGELYVLGGRPGDGKTAIAMHLALEAASCQYEVCEFNFEMSNLQRMNRMFAGHTDIPAQLLRLSELTEAHFRKMESLVQAWQGLPLYIDYNPANTVESIRAQVLLKNKRKKVDLVIVDHLHQMGGKIERGETMEQVISRRVLALKRLALEADCAVLLLSQMNRQIESRAEKNYRPNLSDLRDSGVIEQAADGVFFIHRPNRHGIKKDAKTGESLKNTCELIVRKNRNGLLGSVRLEHNDSFSRFKEI